MKIRVVHKANQSHGFGVVFDFHNIDDEATAIDMAKKKIKEAHLHKFSVVNEEDM